MLPLAATPGTPRPPETAASPETQAEGRIAPLEERRAFVLAHTALQPCLFVPEIRLHMATEVTPLWHATQAWLQARDVDVPFWSVPWAGGQALARFILDNPDNVRGKRVVDFGCGSGLVALACARAGASVVHGIDVDPLAEAAALLNADANAVALRITCADVVNDEAAPRQPADPLLFPLGPATTDVLVAGDVWYDAAAAARFGPFLARLAKAGVRILLGDPERLYVPPGLDELACFDVLTYADLEASRIRRTRVLELNPARA
jgi:predicted nicotinamide N-methyase